MSDFDERMAKLRIRFAARTVEDGAALRAALDTHDWAQARGIAHGLSGTGGVFGYPAVSADAQALEEAIDAGLPDTALRALTDSLFTRLEAIRHESSNG